MPKKLGITATSRVLLVDPPAELVLEPLPAGAVLNRRPGAGSYDVILVFCADGRQLAKRFAPAAARLTTAGGLWICWPKKASGVVTNLGDQAVRQYGLAHGLVDVKVAAIDATWSGLKFVRRLIER